MKGKKSTRNKNFYFTLLKELKRSTNLTKIQKKYNLSKQNLNYYLRKLVKESHIIKKGQGWYEVSKNSTKYHPNQVKKEIRGHAYVWQVNFEKIPLNWNERINILKKHGIHYTIVGAKDSTPRIKVLGRKVWLCNNHIRIYDKKESSYYGETAKECRKQSMNQSKLIVDALNRKLGLSLKVSGLEFKREHYALIDNELAIEENLNGTIWHIRDENGVWLLIDDSLSSGGELETIGKEALKNNIPLQKWWNDTKKHNFEVTPSFILDSFTKTLQNFAEVQKQLSTLHQENQLMKDQLLLQRPERSTDLFTAQYIN